MKRSHQSIGTHNNGTFRKLESVLFDSLEVFSSSICLTDRTRGQVHHLVPVSRDIRVKFRNSEMRPVSSDHCENVAESVGSTGRLVCHLTKSDERAKQKTHLVIVPSISEITT